MDLFLIVHPKSKINVGKSGEYINFVSLNFRNACNFIIWMKRIRLRIGFSNYLEFICLFIFDLRFLIYAFSFGQSRIVGVI